MTTEYYNTPVAILLYTSPLTRCLILTIFFLLFTCAYKAHAEGSADYYPAGASGDRGSMRSNVSLNTASGFIAIRGNDGAFIKVYAQAGEVINVGSSAVGTGNGDIYLMRPDGGLM